MEYNFKDIEAKWQKFWLEHKTFKATEDQSKPKYYALDMFPYPSGSGLHVGHPLGYVSTDIMSRYKRMTGHNVLHPMGWDAFGLPAEQHAVKTGTHPRDTTKVNVDNFRRQIQSIGLSYDWDREINTTDTHYYKWTQWIFLKLYERGLAYQSWEPVNWCPQLGTVLANEEVIDGKSEVGGFPVVKKPMRQWVLKITAYAERLLQDLDDLDWPESLKEMQRHWIGKSVGAEVSFQVKGADEELKVFTTRPDTLFGVSFFVVAPEHPILDKITSERQQQEVRDYVDLAKNRSDRDRIASTEKTGAFTGGYVLNPVNGEEIPVYVADYVLMSYGHGAVMAVPGHDERDHAFAKKYSLPIKRVITGGPEDIDAEAHTGDGEIIHSGFLNGLNKSEAITKACQWLEDNKHGKSSITYKLRDWLFSRQRYWGEPMPLALDKDGKAIAVSEDELPVILPEMEDFKPTGDGEPPLAKATSWLHYEKDGKVYQRETNTMPQWAGSCWYYLRYIDPLNNQEPWNKDLENYWMPVDLYVGGVEHAVLHLLYARFWHKVLYDLGLVSTKEPFQKLVNQGMILGEGGEKMSKSRGNVVNPDTVMEVHGADAFRLYEMFMGPLEATKPWNTDGISGTSRFLKRFWRLLVDESGKAAHTGTGCSQDFEKTIHKTIKKVTDDIEDMRFNTAISTLMEAVNLGYKADTISRDYALALTKLLSPYAPHMSEEIWQIYGHSESIAYASWPSFDEKLCAEDQITISIQVNGKMRGTINVAVDAAKDDVLALAKSQETVSKHMSGKTIRKEIYVPGKIVNFVVS